MVQSPPDFLLHRVLRICTSVDGSDVFAREHADILAREGSLLMDESR